MFNKDQYDQEQFNDYYEQETRGAEILGGRRKKNGSKGLLIGLLLLGLIAIGGYFGFDRFRDIIDKNITSSLKDSSSDKKVVSEGSNETVASDSSSKESKIRDEVEDAVGSSKINAKISPEDIANIVQLVMMKMKEEQEAQAKEAKTSDGENSTTEENSTSSDTELFNSLSQSEVDTVEESKTKDGVKLSKRETAKEASNKEDIKDTYNKVVLKDGSSGEDELSKLSNDISTIVESDNRGSESEYAEKLKEEVKQRKKEMRYIIVKKGDTLGKIAKRVYGNVMAYKKIYEANPDILKRPDRIYIGQKLRVPE